MLFPSRKILWDEQVVLRVEKAFLQVPGGHSSP